ncbi:hypothetical protein AWN88_00315 [Agrobacterium tumefaciens]|nr:hypothetical protein AWN88_00315 [Agrobacterium tumefaciens]KAJ32558.1 amidase [Agrobacterium tumefaciens]
MNNFSSFTAAELAKGFKEKKFSPTEVVEYFLRRIEDINPHINAFYHVAANEARRMAKESAERWMKNAPLSPLDGVPTSIKDALPSIGAPSFRGSLAHNADRQSFEVDAPVVARMREAGMVFLGKTTMPDFGIFASGLSSKHGVTRNPWNLQKTTGGSSSGTAASIAAGLNPLAVGTDIVGSIRLPASFCGIFGFKPSQGRVPYYFPNSPALVAGPMARDVTDASMLMDIIARPDKRDFTALPYDGVGYEAVIHEKISSPRLGFIRSVGFGAEPDPNVLDVVTEAVRVLKSAGYVVEELEVSFSVEDLQAAERFYKSRARAEFNQFSDERRDAATVISEWSAEAETMSAVTLYSDFNRLQSIRERTAALAQDFDFLVLPSVHTPPFDADQPGLGVSRLFEPWINNFIFNLSEQPASSNPCGIVRENLPVGLQIVGQRFADVDVFRLSKSVEELFGWRKTLDAMTNIVPTGF